MDNLFEDNIEKNLLNNKIISTKEDILNNNKVKELINSIVSNNERYNSNKKEMQKIIMKEYILFVNSWSEEIFENFGKYIFSFKDLEKVALFAKYNKTISPSDFIKKIKKIDDLDLEGLIFSEYILQTLKSSITYAKASKDFSEILFGPTEDFYKEFLMAETSILLATITLIKSIKYNYLNYDIAYFDNQNKPKKSFLIKKIQISIQGLFLMDKTQVNLEDFANYIDINYFKKGIYLKESSVSEKVAKYLSYIESNIDVYNDEYSKLVLSEKYLDYVSNKTISPIYISKFPIVKEAFLRRKVLIPKGGVLLLIKDGNKAVESILLKEIYKFEINNFVAITKYRDGKELINTFALSDDFFLSYICWTYKKEQEGYRTCDYIVHFLGGIEMGEGFDKMSYEVISPKYWKYRDRGYKSENDKTDYKGVVIKREFEIEIAPFIRKIDGVASNEAKSLAKKLGVILEDGHTIVKPHIRHYNKQK